MSSKKRHSSLRQPRQPAGFQVRWANVTVNEAKGKKVELPAQRAAAQCQWKMLDLTDDQQRIELAQIDLKYASKTALNEQTLLWVFYELESAAPKLGDLAGFLAEAEVPPAHVNQALLFCGNLTSLIVQLDRMITGAQATLTRGSEPESDPTAPSLKRAATPPPETAQKTCHGRIAPLAVSPENVQKRHQSYGIH
jgi:hypothetical protein